MGKRRMMCTDITRSDAFLELPSTTRLLYFDLLQDADDEGFVDNPKAIMKLTGATNTDMNLLIANKFIILPDQSKGIVVIKHWYIHNYIRKDRMVETNYKELRDSLSMDENHCYTMSAVKSLPDERKEQNDYVREIIEYLNFKTGRNYHSNNKKTISLVKARMGENYTVEDFKRVIDNKCSDWLNDSKFSQYLCPETLFSTKFERYLNQPSSVHSDEQVNYDREDDTPQIDMDEYMKFAEEMKQREHKELTEEEKEQKRLELEYSMKKSNEESEAERKYRERIKKE